MAKNTGVMEQIKKHDPMHSNGNRGKTGHSDSGILTVAVDLTALGERMSGLERYAYRITEAMIHTTRKVRFILVVRNAVPELLQDWRRFSNVQFCVIRGRRKLFLNQFRLPAVMAGLKADRYLFPAFPVPLLFRHPRTYGLIADTACFDCPGTMRQRSVLFFGAGYLHTAAVCHRVITISAFSRGRIEKWLGRQKEEIICAPCAADPLRSLPGEEEIRTVREKYGLPETYWLCLGTLEPRKNLPLLLKAYRELRQEGVSLPPLVLAGRNGWKNRRLRKELAKMERAEDGRRHFDELPAKKSVILTGAVAEDDLPALYAGTDCFFFPSGYEGFGLPPLEAQSCGVRKVVVSDAPALREVMGDTAFYFRKNDLRSLKQALLQAGVWKGCSAAKMRRNLARFSWKASAQKILAEMR